MRSFEENTQHTSNGAWHVVELTQCYYHECLNVYYDTENEIIFKS